MQTSKCHRQDVNYNYSVLSLVCVLSTEYVRVLERKYILPKCTDWYVNNILICVFMCSCMQSIFQSYQEKC